jgi:hypothetical protein
MRSTLGDLTAAKVPMLKTLLRSKEVRAPDELPAGAAPGEQTVGATQLRPNNQPGRGMGSLASVPVESRGERMVVLTNVPPTTASSGPSLCPTWPWVRMGEAYLMMPFLTQCPWSLTPTNYSGPGSSRKAAEMQCSVLRAFAIAVLALVLMIGRTTPLRQILKPQTRGVCATRYRRC